MKNSLLFACLMQVFTHGFGQTLFTVVPAVWPTGYPFGQSIAPLGKILILGGGTFADIPGYENAFTLTTDGVTEKPFSLPYNTWQTKMGVDGSYYFVGDGGFFKQGIDAPVPIVSCDGTMKEICIAGDDIFFGGSSDTIGGVPGNFAKYDVVTGATEVYALPGDIVGIVHVSEDSIVYILTDAVGSSLHKFSTPEGEFQVLSEEENTICAYEGRDMILWNGMPTVTLWEESSYGYVATFDGEWEFSPNLGHPELLFVSPEGELFVSGYMTFDGESMCVAHTNTPGEWHELTDDAGNTVVTGVTTPWIFVCWYESTLFVVGDWTMSVSGLPYAHIYMLDHVGVSVEENMESNTAIFPNPASTYVYIEMPIPATSIELYDVSGKFISTIEVIQNSIVDISQIADGLYFLKYFNTAVPLVVSK